MRGPVLRMLGKTARDLAARIASRKNAKPIPFLKRFHLPMSLVESRIIRRKSLLPPDHSLLSSKEEMLGGLRAARAEFGVLGGDREKGFERVLLAPCVFGNVKRV